MSRTISPCAPAGSGDPAAVSARARMFGLGTRMTRVRRNARASALVTGATLAAAGAVWASGEADRWRHRWGLHHAMRSQARGSACITTCHRHRLAAAKRRAGRIRRHRRASWRRGSGRALYDPRYSTISLHEDPRTLFPARAGGPRPAARRTRAPRSTWRCPAPGTRARLRAFHAVVPRCCDAFQPQTLVSQHGLRHALDGPAGQPGAGPSTVNRPRTTPA